LKKSFFLVDLSHGIHEIEWDKIINPVWNDLFVPFGALILALDVKPVLKLACSVFFLPHWYTLPKTDAKGDKGPACSYCHKDPIGNWITLYVRFVFWDGKMYGYKESTKYKRWHTMFTRINVATRASYFFYRSSVYDLTAVKL
jgi:hypothetical protein